MPKFVPLWTDVSIWLLVLALIAYAFYVRRQANLSATWRKVFADSAALASFVVLVACASKPDTVSLSTSRPARRPRAARGPAPELP